MVVKEVGVRRRGKGEEEVKGRSIRVGVRRPSKA